MEKYITEEAWVKIFMFLKQMNAYYKNEESIRLFIEAVFWIVRTGAQWRHLPKEYGKWNSVFIRFNRWAKKKIWNKLFEECSKDPDLEYIMIDATIVRAHASSAGYGKQKIQALGRCKGGFTTKIHASVDALGNPLKFILSPGNTHESTKAEQLLQDLEGNYVIADKGYDSEPLRNKITQKNSIPVIPSRCNAKNPSPYDKHIYKERHLIECFFSKIKYYRRIFSRFEKSARNFLAFLLFVGTLIWLR